MKEFILGESATLTEQATPDIVGKIADVTGDRNPIHLDESYAANTMFSKRIAHGVFCVGMISKIVGTMMPGEGSVFVEQSFRYLRPVYLDDYITSTVRIAEVLKKDKLRLAFDCVNQNHETVIEGEAIVKVLEF